MKRVLAILALRALIVVGLLVAGYSVSLLTRPPAPQILRVSAAATDTAIARGRVVYDRWGCAACHGEDGKGGFANPNSETSGRVPGVTAVADGYLKSELRRYLLKGNATIGKEDPKGPRPPFRMPGWAGQMTEEEAADLTEYLFSLFKPAGEGKS